MIQFTSITKNGDGSWTFAWASTGDLSYRVVLRGTYLAEVATPSFSWTRGGYSDFPPPVEVVPAGQRAASEVYPDAVTLQWYGVAGAASYIVQQYDGSSWETVGTVDHPDWVNSWRTGRLADDAPYQFRVLAVGAAGDLSGPLPFTFTTTCLPQSPDGMTAFAYSGGVLTIS